MALTPCDFPDKKTEPKYMAWKQMLDEFVELKVPCARVDNIVADQKTVSQIRMCSRAMHPDVTVRTKQGVIYLLREC